MTAVVLGVGRRGYIDWLRGILVLIMIEAHTLDAWTRLDARQNGAYGWAMIVGGFGAPGFLFLAGIAIACMSCERTRIASGCSTALPTA